MNGISALTAAMALIVLGSSCQQSRKSEKNKPDSRYLNLKVKLDSYFDCRGETNDLFNEKYAKVK